MDDATGLVGDEEVEFYICVAETAVVFINGTLHPCLSSVEGLPTLKLRVLIGHFVVSQNSYFCATILLVDSSCPLNKYDFHYECKFSATKGRVTNNRISLDN